MQICPLTNHSIDLKQDGGRMVFYYENPIFGTIKFTDVAIGIVQNLSEKDKDILKGLIRNNKDKGEPPIEINSRILNQLNNLDIPYDFESRARYFLKYLYDHGGKEYRTHNLNSSTDNAITYSSRDEFERIIRYLKADGFISYDNLTPTKQANFYQSLSITKEGINEIEKGLPKMPLFGLVDQKISTGDTITDDKLKHARALFFDENPTIDKMRSACEVLIFIMEPLRKELEGLFDGDTEYFFNIVNNFTIRHNKVSTKAIETPEQFEWIFYSLLNTINAYVKMKRRFK